MGVLRSNDQAHHSGRSQTFSSWFGVDRSKTVRGVGYQKTNLNSNYRCAFPKENVESDCGKSVDY